MNTTRIYCLPLMFLLTLTSLAQQVNKFYAGNVNCMKSVSVDMPFYLDNTTPNIVAVQFQLTVPKDVSVSTNTNDVKLEITRTVDHAARLSERNKVYNVIVISPTNTSFKANKGKLFTLKTSVASNAALEEGQTYPVTISNVVLSDSLGNNVMTAYDNGSITLVPCPDFTVSDIIVSSEEPVVPNEPVQLSWKVNNIGSANSQGGWSEQVTFVSTTTGESCPVTTMHYSQPLNAGASVERSGTVLVPRILGLDGPFRVQVKVVPNNDSGESMEYQSNNTTQSTNTYTLAKKLYLSFPSYDLTESNNDKEYYFYLERSGSRKESMTFTFSPVNGDNRIELPTSVTISQNSSSVYAQMKLKGDNLLNGDTIVYSYAVDAAYGYETATGSGRIIDDEYPQITLTPSKTKVDEGETFQITLTASGSHDYPVWIKLSAEQPTRFKMPTKVKLPAGETQVTFDVTVVEDNVVNIEQGILFTASADRYEQGQCEVIVGDNDMPTLSMNFSTTTISEGGGAKAVAVTITRTGKTNSELTIRLTDDADPMSNMLNYSTRTVTMKKGTTTAKFYIGANDNIQMDGDRDVTITASVYVKTCNCSVPASAGGVLTQTIHIVDNDGPTLQLESKNPNLLEGSTDNEFSVKINGTLSSALPVTISCTKEGDVKYNKTVTIPAGSTEATFNVEVLRNAVSGDSHRITFYADASGWSRGVSTVLVTDQTLPDGTITALSVITPDVAVEDSAIVETTIANVGYDVLKINTPVTFIHGQKQETHYIEADIAPGATFTQRDKIGVSSVAGTYSLYAVIDQTGKMREVNKDNNQSESVELVVKPLFTATAMTDTDKYLNTETVRISGNATGLHPYNTDIEVYVVSPSHRYVLKTRTDEKGHYYTEWKPEGNIAGHFGVGACTPGEGLTTEMAQFEMYGMRRYDYGYLLNEFEIGEEPEGYIEIENHGSMKLTGIEAQVVDMPENATITLSEINTLRPGEHKTVTFKYQGLKPSEGDYWDKVRLKFVSNEGAEFEQSLSYYVYSPLPVLKASVDNINTTMIKDKTRDITLTLRNEGHGNTGEMSLDLGNTNWLRAATPMKMAPLSQGEETTIVLQLTPTPSMELNSIITGNIAVRCANENVDLVIPMRVEVVSEETGTMVIDVVDEFTIRTEEAPHVEGATVSVLHPVTGKLLRKAVTDSDGLAKFEKLNEGSYTVKVTHPKHSSWENMVLVNPARSTTEQVFLQYSAVSVQMTYEKTEIEDEYDIKTTVEYETQVPAPVVLLDMPDEIILDEIDTPYMFYAYLTNVGLVTALDAEFFIPEETNGYRFTPLVEGPWDILPQQTITIPVEITKIDEGEQNNPSESRRNRQVRRSDVFHDIACGLLAFAHYFDRCGMIAIHGMSDERRAEKEVQHLMKLNQVCGGGDTGNADPYDTQWTKPAVPSRGHVYTPLPGTGFGGGNGPRKPWNTQCDPWLVENGPKVIKTLLSFASPALSWGFNIYDAGEGDWAGLLGAICGQALSFLKISWMNRTNYNFSQMKYRYYDINKTVKLGDEEYALQIMDDFTVFDLKNVPGEMNFFWANCDDLLNYGLFANSMMGFATDDDDFSAGSHVRTSPDASLTGVSPVETRMRANAVLSGGPEILWQPIYLLTDDNGKSHTYIYSELMNYYSSKIALVYDAVAKGIERIKPDGVEAPCGFKNAYYATNEPDLSDVENPAVFPSAFKAWSDNTVVSWYTYYHSALIMHEIFGDWKFGFFDEETTKQLKDYLEKVGETENGYCQYLISDDIVNGLLTAEDRKYRKTAVSGMPCPRALGLGNFGGAPFINDFVRRLNNTLSMLRGNEVKNDNYIHFDRILEYMQRMDHARKYINRKGYEDEFDMMWTEDLKLYEYLMNKQEGMCAKVKLELDQKLTMTREAVRGTLTVENGSETTPLRDVKLDLVVTDPYGNVATPHIMQISTESLEGFEGELDYESGWSLDALQTGVAKILFIPTKYAAPTEPLQYTFSGTISFIDPFTGLEVTRELEPERLTVNPSPNLELTYFMQRDIFGDDALTKEVEPIVPSQFSLLINNKGYGDATKVRMLTQQPKIVDNEKGLMVDFEIVSSQLNGGEKTLALGESVTTDFGNIPAHSQAYAQWWLTSSLTGHFINYDVEATHVTSYDNPDLSLLDTVTIHELIHQIAIPFVSDHNPPLIGFLTNDTEDYKDYPDMLYLSNGETVPVAEASETSWTKVSEYRYLLRVQPSALGWNYGNIIDPTGGTATVTTVLRNRDNTILPVVNFWQTDRTLIDRMDPVYENLLHFADEMSLLTGESYIVDFEPKPAAPLAVERFSGVPQANAFTREPVTVVTVAFNRPIDETTFTTDDIRLTIAGEPLDVSGLQIVKLNEQTFQIDLSSLTTLDGYYLFTVQAAGIADGEGITGTEGQQTGWTQVADGMANLTMLVEPEGAGSVTPGTSKQDFFGEVMLTAIPAEGYTFSGWQESKKVLSTETPFAYTMMGNKTVTAVFNPKKYDVKILYNKMRGSVIGAGSGQYDYHQQINLKAEPSSGYYFVGWKVGELVVSEDPEFTFTVQGNAVYEAVFEQVNYVELVLDEASQDDISPLLDAHGKYFFITLKRHLKPSIWNPFCSPIDISEFDICKILGYDTKIIEFYGMDGSTTLFKTVADVKAGMPYLIMPEREVERLLLECDENVNVSATPKTIEASMVKFCGIYTPYEWGTHMLRKAKKTDNEYYFDEQQCTYVLATESTNALSGYRFYVTAPADIIITGLRTEFDDEVSVDDLQITSLSRPTAMRIYNLQGQFLGNKTEHLPAGLYIINGKKRVIR